MSEDGYCEKEIHNRIGPSSWKEDTHGREKTEDRQITLGTEQMNYKVSSLKCSTACYRDVNADAGR